MFDSLKSYLGTERIGDWELSDVKVLLYLHSNEAEARLSSPEKLGDELGIAEATVTNAFDRLRRRGCIAPTSEGGNPRDPREYLVTWRGKRALRPFLNVFGYADVSVLCALAFALGGAIGVFYSSRQFYPSYLVAELLVTAIFAAGLLGFGTYTVLTARKNRREQLDLILRKPSQPAGRTSESPSTLPR